MEGSESGGAVQRLRHRDPRPRRARRAQHARAQRVASCSASRRRPAADPGDHRQRRPAALLVGVRGRPVLLRRRRDGRLHARRPVITRDELYAVGATFTLVAWAFAYTFVVCQAIYPGSFTAAIDPAADRTWMELLFLSFTTLSSTGLSDVVPGRGHGPQHRDGRAARRPGVSGDRRVTARRADGAPARARRALSELDRRQRTSAGSSLPCRRSRPRWTAAMNFERLTSRVLRISSA